MKWKSRSWAHGSPRKCWRSADVPRAYPLQSFRHGSRRSCHSPDYGRNASVSKTLRRGNPRRRQKSEGATGACPQPPHCRGSSRSWRRSPRGRSEACSRPSTRGNRRRHRWSAGGCLPSLSLLAIVTRLACPEGVGMAEGNFCPGSRDVAAFAVVAGFQMRS